MISADAALYQLYAGGRKYFSDGWGDVSKISRSAFLRHFGADAEPPAAERFFARIRWYGGCRRDDGAGVHSWKGAFASPAAELAELQPLPAEVCTAYCKLVGPAALLGDGAQPRLGDALAAPLLVSIAASGDHDYRWRSGRLAVPLARSHGVCTVMLMQPYYGKRRPGNQTEHYVRSVADLMRMGQTTIVEGYALLNALHWAGHRRLVVTGFSQGGTMASSIAALFDRADIGVALCIPASSAADVFCAGVIATSVDWPALGPPDDPATVDALRRLLDQSRIDGLPLPAGHRVLVVGARADGFVDQRSVRRLADAWGAPVVWHCGGHITAYLFATPLFRRVIVDTFAMLHAGATPLAASL